MNNDEVIVSKIGGFDECYDNITTVMKPVEGDVTTTVSDTYTIKKSVFFDDIHECEPHIPGPTFSNEEIVDFEMDATCDYDVSFDHDVTPSQILPQYLLKAVGETYDYVDLLADENLSQHFDAGSSGDLECIDSEIEMQKTDISYLENLYCVLNNLVKFVDESLAQAIFLNYDLKCVRNQLALRKAIEETPPQDTKETSGYIKETFGMTTGTVTNTGIIQASEDTDLKGNLG